MNIICKFIISIVIVIQIHPTILTAQDNLKTKEKLLAIANAVLQDATFKFVDRKSGRRYSSTVDAQDGAQLVPESPYNDWRYWNGVLNIAMLRLGEVIQKPEFNEFAQKNIAFNFDNAGYFEKKYGNEGKWNYPYGEFFIMEELDDCGAMGASVIEVYKQDRQERYLNYINRAANHIFKKQSRLEDGTFVRSFPYKWTLWADDLYMSLSFLSRQGELTNEMKYFDDAAQQVINFHKYLFDNQKSMMHHFWYSDVNRKSAAYWGRANGWAMLAQVDLLDRLPNNHPQRDTLIILLRQHILGISQYQNGNGLWYQLLDKPDSYEETSCSAMFTYAIARAVNKEYIEPRYTSIALRGWQGVMTKIRVDGQVEGVCAGTVTSDDLVHYYKRPTPLNDIHGIGAVILAGIEVMQMKQ